MMTRFTNGFSRFAEFVAGMMMLAMFATFILQIAIRYSARLEWLSEAVPFLDPTRFGWTLEFNLLLWVWIVFWGNSFIVKERDHVTFDIIYGSVSPTARKWFAIVGSVAVCVVMVASIPETWERFSILRLKRTATLDQLFGDWIRMRDVYSIYILFLAVVALRYAARAIQSFRFGADSDLHHFEDLVDQSKSAGARK